MWDIGLNYWAILSCAAVQAVIGMAWYSKAAFGPRWMTLLGKTEDDIRKGNPAKAITGSVLGALVTAYVMALMVFATGASTPWEGLQVGFLMWLGFSAVPHFNNVLFENQSIGLFLVNSGFNLAVFVVMSELLTLWQ